jgi:hypothetical protein
MNDLVVLQSFFGWASIVGIVFISFVAILLFGFRKQMISMHQKIINIPEDKLNVLYFNFMAIFKIAIYVAFVIPYIALYILNS